MKNLNIEFLNIIKDLGNSSIHPNNGDISSQVEIDDKLLEVVDIVFAELLDKEFEQPIKNNRNLNLLIEKKRRIND